MILSTPALLGQRLGIGFRWVALGLWLGALAGAGQAQSPAPDNFNPGVTGGFVTALAVQPDGRILVGGNFSMVAGQFRSRLARLNADGSLDEGFNPEISGDSVAAIAIQGDGKVVIGGTFGWVGGQMRSGLARLNANGSLDTGFNVEVSGGGVSALAIQTDGKILLGGSFTWAGGQLRSGLARLEASGALDASFDPGLGGGTPSVVALQLDGKILVGGSFTTLAGQSREALGRLNATGSLDSDFAAYAGGGAVLALAVQADGKILAGGSFATLNGQSREYFGRFTAEGQLEWNFGATVSGGQVSALALQTDGKILLGGAFTSLGNQTREGLGRLNADGNVDYGFTTTTGGGSVAALALQADGKLLAGGPFTSLNGQSRNGIGRLNPTDPATQSLTNNNTTATWLRGGTSPEIIQAIFDRTADGVTWTRLGTGTRIPGGWQLTGFNLPVGETIRARGYVTGTGWFVDFMRGPEITGQPASLTVSFGQSATFSVSATGLTLNYQWWKDGQALPQRTNAVLMLTNLVMPDAGQYSVVVSNAYGSVTSAVATLVVEKVEILNQPASQSRSPGQSVTFTVLVTGSDLRYQWWKDGVVLPQRTNASLTLSNLQYSDIAQYYVVITNRYGNAISSIAELTINPAMVDAGFNPGANNTVRAIAVQPDGKSLIGGYLDTLAGQPRRPLGRLNADGTLDESFNARLAGGRSSDYSTLSALAIQPDGKILAGGEFNTAGGQPHTNIVRLNQDGTVDSTFNQQANYDVLALLVQPDGKILVGGYFQNLVGSWHHAIERLNPDGTPDPGFSGTTSGSTVWALALQTDGKILVGGNFNWLSGQTRNNFGRLNHDGSLDQNFVVNLGADDYPQAYSLAVQSNGRILVGGDFTTVNGQPCSNLFRVNGNGVLDSTFTPIVNGAVRTMAVQSDGKIVIGGVFNSVNGQARTNLARLNADGTLDPNFQLQTTFGYVHSLALQSDGKVLVGGYFSYLGGYQRSFIARLQNTAPASQSLIATNSTVLWRRGSGSPELRHATLEYATVNASWNAIPGGFRTVGGWQWNQAIIPANAAVRVRGSVVGPGNADWFIELLQRPFPSVPPAILLNDGSFGVAAGGFGFNVQGQPGQVVIVDQSTNLGHWSPAATNTLSNTSFRYEDPAWRNQPARNYRARLWP